MWWRVSGVVVGVCGGFNEVSLGMFGRVDGCMVGWLLVRLGEGLGVGCCTG